MLIKELEGDGIGRTTSEIATGLEDGTELPNGTLTGSVASWIWVLLLKVGTNVIETESWVEVARGSSELLKLDKELKIGTPTDVARSRLLVTDALSVAWPNDV